MQDSPKLRSYNILSINMKELLYELIPCRPCDARKLALYVKENAFDSVIGVARGLAMLGREACSVSLRSYGLLGVWIGCAYMSLRFGGAGFAQSYVIFSILVVMLLNLGKRETGTLSAYSVFNEGRRLMGDYLDFHEREMEQMFGARAGARVR